MAITETLHATRTPSFLVEADTGVEKGTVASPIVVSGATTSLAIGTTADAAVTDPTVVTSAATLIALVKGWLTGLGAVADSAWTSGSGSVIALVKAIAGRLPASLGSKAASASLSVVPAGYEYETVAASQTDQALGATGAAGDFLSHIVIQPTTTAAGTVTVKDGTTVIFTFTTGTLADLKAQTIPFNAFSVNGAWKVTTGANVAVIGFGDFT